MPETGMGWEAVEELWQLRRRRNMVGMERDMAWIFLMCFFLALFTLYWVRLVEDWGLGPLQAVAVALLASAGLCGLTVLGIFNGGQLLHPASEAGDRGNWRPSRGDTFLLLPFSGEMILARLNRMYGSYFARILLAALVGVFLTVPEIWFIVMPAFLCSCTMAYFVVCFPDRKTYKGFGFMEVRR